MSYNKSYHRFFEGYTEKEVYDAGTGKRHIERVYVGPYFRHKMDDKAWKKLKVKYLLILLWSINCMIIQGVSVSAAWYTVIPSAVTLLSLLWLAFYVLAYVSHGRELEIRQYRDRELLKGTAALSAAAFGLSMVGTLVESIRWIISFGYFDFWGFLCAILDASAMLLLIYMFRTERNMDYIKKDNEKKADPDAYDIRYNTMND